MSEHSEDPSTAPPKGRPVHYERERARRACQRCRRKKIRCRGGAPCTNCTRVHQICDFGPTPEDGQAGLSLRDLDFLHESAQKDARLAQLEKTVQLLSARLDPPKRPFPPDPSKSFHMDNFDQDPSSGSGQALQMGTDAAGKQEQGIEGSSYESLISSLYPGPSAPDSSLLNVSQGIDFAGLGTSPTRPDVNNRPTESQSHAVIPSPAVSDQHTPESRLALATQTAPKNFAPLRPLSYDPAYWQIADQTRPPSPLQHGPLAVDFWDNHLWSRPGRPEDPIQSKFIDEGLARTLFDFYLESCQPFLPIMYFVQHELSPFDEIRQSSPFLLTVVLAIAARFHHRRIAAMGGDLGTFSQAVFVGLRHLAYAQVASTLLSRRHSLRDVQAVLLLAAWGLRPGGNGPEPWVLLGHCGRLARRLGLDQSGFRRLTDEKDAARWMTWLCWNHLDELISLGFGRPHTRSVDRLRLGGADSLLESVRERPPAPEVASGLFLSALTELGAITSRLVRFMQANDPNSDGYQRDSNTKKPSVEATIQDLNDKLDVWADKWLWNGSMYWIRLGKHVPLLKLQCGHVRLCLHALILPQLFGNGEAPPEKITEAGLPQKYARMGTVAALDIIQTFANSAEGDRMLNYALDYYSLILGQAAVFLLRLYLAPPPIIVERPAILHHLQVAIDLLQSTDFSESGHSTHVSLVCRDLCRAAGVQLPSDKDKGPNSFPQDAAPMPQGNMEFNPFEGLDSGDYDLASMLGVDVQEMTWGAP